jgi:hypothetical protein
MGAGFGIPIPALYSTAKVVMDTCTVQAVAINVRNVESSSALIVKTFLGSGGKSGARIRQSDVASVGVNPDSAK